MTLSSKITEIREKFLRELKLAKTSRQIENLKISYLGKKGPLQALMQHLKDATKEERPLFGKQINDVKLEITSHLENTLKRLLLEEETKKLENEYIDVTLPGRKHFWGRYHPVTLTMNKMIDVFVSMGFAVETGPDVDSDFYNFEGLNFAKDHPSRDMQDTFFITDDLLLRTHTSNVQVRTMERVKPPIRCIAPGKCFRNETISSRSHVFFHQVEMFYIDENVSFADLFATLNEFLSKLFKKQIETRFRPSYFPFVEPGMECDIKCIICSGQGCRLCKDTGWLEVFGAGMIHPNVLKAGGIDPEKYSGYAAGLGVERLAMLIHQINDIRMFTENDMRFLKQFSL
ncbi:MAG: Phenylalanine--tRNA ligase alpha subunit [Candidatus Anoxychlamydiales bacterium]|uniref:Phenylalanine--tRNA ligase alpha subunit n=1 Tax=marine sediment metagenome TaxID=412755 RepID=A0A0F9E2Z5_9ZZZZ|nr:Phenylalanine--tRNA ligase alpha subunit [Candidatus Anoxychlamydiales bacterium]NGX41727.1 Phenylalanine--tRNA ligase alpha subunit [Candidatus Anoxychlamydiales bacterium]HEU64813.1 phenylalanine--tRNA ligase subunit alpha [Chlamydiota bacterium]